MRKKTTKLAFILSFLGHVLLISLLILSAHHQKLKQTDRVAFITAHIEIDSGVLAKTKNHTEVRKNNTPSNRVKYSSASEQGIAKSKRNKRFHHQNLQNKAHDKQNVISRRAEQKKINHLLVRIHNLIYAKQQYPKAALIMGIEGACKVEFTLYPDGRMDNIILLRSSGNANLDRAAILSVKAISPISQAEKYIKTKETLSTWIRFQIK